jgi:hypothetical protein
VTVEPILPVAGSSVYIRSSRSSRACGPHLRRCCPGLFDPTPSTLNKAPQSRVEWDAFEKYVGGQFRSLILLTLRLSDGHVRLRSMPELGPKLSSSAPDQRAAALRGVLTRSVHIKSATG